MDINQTIAVNLKCMREQKKLSLDTAAALTGVSRSMLSQIEKGDVNPTISILWKISEGYRVPFTALIDSGHSPLSIIRIADAMRVTGYDEAFTDYIVFPFDNERRFETHYVTIIPGGSHHSTAHLPGTEEYITIFSGKLRITVKDEIYLLNPGDSICFLADVSHSYENIGESDVSFHSIMVYK